MSQLGARAVWSAIPATESSSCCALLSISDYTGPHPHSSCACIDAKVRTPCQKPGLQHPVLFQSSTDADCSFSLTNTCRGLIKFHFGLFSGCSLTSSRKAKFTASVQISLTLDEKLQNTRSSLWGGRRWDHDDLSKRHTTLYGNPLITEQEWKTLKAGVCN